MTVRICFVEVDESIGIFTSRWDEKATEGPKNSAAFLSIRLNCGEQEYMLMFRVSVDHDDFLMFDQMFDSKDLLDEDSLSHLPTVQHGKERKQTRTLQLQFQVLVKP